ncbi:MAG TPA: ATP-binding cassette domain-containing protein [Candidatus Paceibacterota bacterium]|nr:ATP-binding cassette domain-containing protein [Verrucomicrobiota bacterium]HRY47130.1 ATP-binding cassette domain-containing protein [Candidatus Paceibacterota bacterium]
MARQQSESLERIVIHGAREHNLKDITLAFPRDRLVVISGVSGSGKSTLAFDILFAEGQRRFLDSMNAYARQFVDQMARPDVDLISGLPPTVSIEQRTTRGGGKSTVGTVTEVFHFVRLLFARLGTIYCPACQLPVARQTRDQLERQLRAEQKKRGDLLLLAPVVRNRKGFHSDVAVWASQRGYAEIRADGRIHPTSEPLRLARFQEHNVEIVVGVLEEGRKRSQASPAQPRKLIEEALRLGQGTLYALDNARKQTVHSLEQVCPDCGQSYETLDPKMLSFNSARGWCPRCRGFGELFYLPEVERGARAEDIEESWFDWMEGKREPCPECGGSRLNALARAVRLPLGPSPDRDSGPSDSEITLETVSGWSVETAAESFQPRFFTGRAGLIARDIIPEIRERLRFLETVGLGYLQLGRAVTTLSGGESQRIRLAAQLGSNLSGVMYVLDEPTIGLHARDNEQLLDTLEALKARGNTLVVVEHDEATLRRADFIVDLGPGAGRQGGQVVASGTLSQLLKHADSVTGQCLRRHRTYPARGERRPVRIRDAEGLSDGSSMLVLRNANRNNLKNLTVNFPLNRLVVVTGVSGSGKSTLIRECLRPCVEGRLGGKGDLAPMQLEGWDHLRAIHEVDQSPIGRTPRSIPATYVGFFDEIRQLFARVPESRLRGYSPSRFSFNSAQGRCPTCEGAGVVKLTMNFLPPAFIRCESCGGSRFTRETLDIEYQGRNIAQVLEMSVADAALFFANHSAIRQPLKALIDTGLDYLKLGQTSPTLSGGEAQRVKLVTHLLSGLKMPRTASPRSDAPPPKARGSRAASGSLFLLEEPTIGLHSADVVRLVEVLQRLVDAGHSVIVIEHNLELIAEADWLIDLGPEAGDDGGRIVAAGTPEALAKNKRSHTGRFLRNILSPS